MRPLLEWLDTLDRRFIFLLIALAVIIPLILEKVFPEKPTGLVQGVFDRIEGMDPGSRVLLSCDYDPGSAPELQPMATAIARHCAEKGHKIYFMALWPVGPEMVNVTIREAIEITPKKVLEQAAWEIGSEVRELRKAAEAAGKGEELSADRRRRVEALELALLAYAEFAAEQAETVKDLPPGEIASAMEVPGIDAGAWIERARTRVEAGEGEDLHRRIREGVLDRSHPDMVYGRDYVNLGYKPGNEGVIKVIITDLKKLYTTDHRGTSIDDIPMTKATSSVQDMDLIVNISAGYPGTKEWVQYAAQPFGLDIAAGCTGVQAPLLYPYIPEPLFGLIGAIKGAAEYEAALREAYPKFDDDRLHKGVQRMGPQMIAHLTILILIIVGNITFFATRRRRRPGGAA